MQYLVIVESPFKIGKLEAILPKNYKVLASYGHIMDLDPDTMALDFDNDFKPKYKFYPKSSQNNKKLLDAYKKCKKLILAVDQDREGEFIGESLLKLFHTKEYERISFNAITKKTIEYAIEHPTKLCNHQINAQKTRRYMDRMFGYGLSELLKRIPGVGKNKKLGCGRVQSTIVKLIIEQDRKVNKALLSSHSLTFEGTGEFVLNDDIVIKTYLANSNHKKMVLPSTRCSTTMVADIVSHAPLYVWEIGMIKRRTFMKSPKPPFTTATLQCTAANGLRWPVKQIMDVAQKLYEKGFITYMRSDSTMLSEEALNGCEKLIKKKFGNEFSNRHQYSEQIENAQEAHEAIRPTSLTNNLSTLDENQKKLYEVIWKRTVASQMSKAQVESCNIPFIPYSMGCERSFRMIGNKSGYIFKGYMAIYSKEDLENFKNNEESGDSEDRIDDILPSDENFYNSIISMNKMTIKEKTKNPPSRYTESQLVKTVTQIGIGRPATTCGFISKIQDKDYVRMENTDGVPINTIQMTFDRSRKNPVQSETVVLNVGSENKRLVPTPLGILINDFLEENFPQMMNLKFTANLENQLSDIVSNKVNWIDILHDFWNNLKPQITRVEKKYEISAKSFDNNTIICKYKGNDVEYVKIKAGTFLLVTIEGKKLWIKSMTKPKEKEAIKMIEDRLNRPATKVIKTFGKNYVVKESNTGQFIQVTKGKKCKFFQLRDIDVNSLTKEKCDKLTAKLFQTKSKRKY
jgi:DNA topoisomerase I